MMKRWFYGAMLFLAGLASADDDATALVRIDITGMSEQEIGQLAAMNIDITSIQRAQGRMDAILTGEQRRAVAARGIACQAIIPDMSAYAQRLRDENYFDHFHDNEQILQKLRAAADDHPHISALVDIGDSYLKTIGRGGHDIWALKISDEVDVEDSTEADVLYMANMHAREIITPEIILFFMDYLLDHYGSDPYVTHLVNHRELWLIPTFNPDGHEYVFTGDATYRDYPGVTDPLWWRKNMRDNDADGQFNPLYDGVDLNRNFGFMWGADDAGSSGYFSDPTYRGAAPFSEPESQLIRELVLKHHFIISLCYHSYGNLWLYPWGYTFESAPEPDVTIFRALADSCVTFNKYKAEPSATLYLVNGDTDDWLYGDQGVWAFTAEVGDAAIDHYFFPDTNRILPLVLENLGPNLFMAYAAGEEPIVKHVATLDTIEQNGIFDITATIAHPIVLTDSVALDSSSFRIYYRQESDDHFTSTPLSFADSLHVFKGAIPAAGLSGLIYYYVEAQDSSGRRGTSPLAAPSALDSFYVALPTHQLRQKAEIVQLFQLEQNYPNPFNASTRITFQLPKACPASVDIYDVSGRFVRNLSQGMLDAGKHAAFWDGRDISGRAVASGIYYCRLQAPLLQKSIKMVLLR
ncbi:T9SS type A sorting domain-containing protein [candidate division KSB1 bacterium]|nr:T9SS type A sorting domain-containing protein [candidate division KSB1 bacterium]